MPNDDAYDELDFVYRTAFAALCQALEHLDDRFESKMLAKVFDRVAEDQSHMAPPRVRRSFKNLARSLLGEDEDDPSRPNRLILDVIRGGRTD